MQHGKLGDEGFGGGDADFPPGAGEDGVRGGTGQRAFGNVADGEVVEIAPVLFAFFQGGEGVGGFAGLGEGDEQGVCRHGDGAVEVFAGVFNAGRDAVFFEVVFHDQPGVVAGAAGDDVDLPRACEAVE